MSKRAFVFPGQGAQFVGMGKDIVDNYTRAAEIFEMADSILGYDLQKVIFQGPKQELDNTENTQPAILTISYAILEILKSKKITADGYAGLSLGEYCALVGAGVMDFKAALPLVKKRGMLMQQAVPKGVGKMVALIGITPDGLNDLISSVQQGYVAVANYNCPGQYVVTGETKAVQEASLKARDFGARRVIELDVSGPFHSKLLNPAGEKLAGELEKIVIDYPKSDVYSNVTAEKYPKDNNEIQKLLVDQITHSVLWQQTIENMIKDGYTEFVEIGPQKTLSGMIKKINKGVSINNIENLQTLDEYLEKGVR